MSRMQLWLCGLHLIFKEGKCTRESLHKDYDRYVGYVKRIRRVLT